MGLHMENEVARCLNPDNHFEKHCIGNTQLPAVCTYEFVILKMYTDYFRKQHYHDDISNGSR